jgi:hypothetical protein
MNLWVIFILFGLGFLLFAVILVYLRRTKPEYLNQKAQNYIQSHWVRIIDSFSANPAQAVMDADKLLDYALGVHGFKGTMGEKLKKCGRRFSDLDSIWSAHKLRNRLAHELGGLERAEAKAALAGFKQGLNDLGARL